jgi:hypothetical protein
MKKNSRVIIFDHQNLLFVPCSTSLNRLLSINPSVKKYYDAIDFFTYENSVNTTTSINLCIDKIDLFNCNISSNFNAVEEQQIIDNVNIHDDIEAIINGSYVAVKNKLLFFKTKDL